ncbi:MAG: GNAT family N-acetyltransferase [Deltaproteobacteria bacterium]|nr:GNAT family N-acetyltransferase [Deltaproteobacteria bacterium]
MAERRYVIDGSWEEHAELRDGTQVRLRLIRPDDKQLLADGLARMSPESRYYRFFSAKDHLTSAELRYLTELDGENHVAIGAARTGPSGEDVGMGVARFIRFRDRPEVAEAAVTVIDEAQGLGLGKILLSRLLVAASERGVKRFQCDFLAHNKGMRALVEALADQARYGHESGVIQAEFSLEGPSGLFGALAGVARREGQLTPGAGFPPLATVKQTRRSDKK